MLAIVQCNVKFQIDAGLARSHIHYLSLYGAVGSGTVCVRCSGLDIVIIVF